MEHQSTSADSIEKVAEKKPKSKSTDSNWLFGRPGPETKGIVDWLTTIDPKKVGLLYAVMGLICLIVVGLETLLIQTQLLHPENTYVTTGEHNQLLAINGTTMLFLVVMPLSAALFNFVIPLQIGASNVAFPRINTLSLWCFIAGVIIVFSSWFLPGEATSNGWFGKEPPRLPHSDMGMSADFWVIGLLVLGLASLLASFNVLTTIINMRCPGMTMMRLPVLTWMALISSFLMILAAPAITAALMELLFDRQFGTRFFDNKAVGTDIAWQHLFRIFRHPEVYILILPAMGIISEILPTFSRKPLWGYRLIIFSGVMIGFLGFSAWSLHMFTTGSGAIPDSGFSILTILFTIPTGLILMSWLGTLFGGSIRVTTPMLFTLSFIFMLLVGGVSGILNSTTIVDAQIQTDYLAIAQFHYVFIGGSIFSLLAGFYYWVPIITGSLMSGKLGKFYFTLIFVGFNLTFFPMHYLSMEGIAKSNDTDITGKGWDDPNMLVTIGAFLLGLGILSSTIQIIHSVINRKKLPKSIKDPWDARTLEWTVSFPIPIYNFSRTPIVKARDQYWIDKYEPEQGKLEYEPSKSQGVYWPDGSWWPLFTSIGIFVLGAGFITRKIMFSLPGGEIWEHNFELILIGTAITLMSIMFWSTEGSGGHQLQSEQEANYNDD